MCFHLELLVAPQYWRLVLCCTNSFFLFYSVETLNKGLIVPLHGQWSSRPRLQAHFSDTFEELGSKRQVPLAKATSLTR